MMRDKQKFLGGFLLGAIAGAALTVFFNSDKGKEVIADAKARFNNLNLEIDNLLAKGKIFLDEMEAKISEA